MTKEERDRLRALCAKATPGPWEIEREELGVDFDDEEQATAMPEAIGPWQVVDHAFVNHEGSFERIEADAALIASARTAIPSLLTTLDEYEEENARLRAAGTALRTLACHVTGRGTVESCKCGAIVRGPLAKGAGIAHDRQCPVPKWDAMVGRCTCGDDYVAVTATHAVWCAALQGKPRVKP